MKLMDLTGKVAIVTGANTGIGKVTAMELARLGARVFLACRSREKTLSVVEEIREKSGNPEVEYLELDLASFESIRECAEAFRARGIPLHLLVNNAGVAGAGGLTRDGFELTFGVNHLGHFLLTRELLGVMEAPARIVNVASTAHYSAGAIDYSTLRQPSRNLTGLSEYNVSKLANVLFSGELGRRLKGTGIQVYSLHPGVVGTDVWRHIPRPLSWIFRWVVRPFMLTEEQGARTTMYCAASPEVALETGLYYDRCRTKRPSKVGEEVAAAEELWRHSDKWVGTGEADWEPASLAKESVDVACP